MIAHFAHPPLGRDIDSVTLHAGDLSVTLLTWGCVAGRGLRVGSFPDPRFLLADYEGEMRYSTADRSSCEPDQHRPGRD
jgi:aldose 1-epimerase